MATLAGVAKFIRELSALAEGTSPHVWLGEDHGVVVGKFPDPHLRFDFAQEKFVPIAGNEVAPHVSPAGAKPVISLIHKGGRQRTRIQIEATDAVYEVGSATQMLVEGLNIVERLRPGTITKLSREKGRTKRPVAASREDLYDVPHPPEHSSRLDNGYFVATNNKAREALGFLKRAIQIAGLEEAVAVRGIEG